MPGRNCATTDHYTESRLTSALHSPRDQATRSAPVDCNKRVRNLQNLKKSSCREDQKLFMDQLMIAAAQLTLVHGIPASGFAEKCY